MSHTLPSSVTPGAFPHTRWSVVLAATRQDGANGEDALELVCSAYWFPLYAFVRRSGQSPHERIRNQRA